MSAATPANVFLGTGRRKTSTARVRISEGSGKLLVNGREFENYFSHENFAKQAYAPLLVVDMKEKIDVSANVTGGGVAGQAGAVAHGIARALGPLGRLGPFPSTSLFSLDRRKLQPLRTGLAALHGGLDEGHAREAIIDRREIVAFLRRLAAFDCIGHRDCRGTVHIGERL